MGVKDLHEFFTWVLWICDKKLSISFIPVINLLFFKHILITYIISIQEFFLNGDQVSFNECPQFITWGILLHLTHLQQKPDFSDLCGSMDLELSNPGFTATSTFH